MRQKKRNILLRLPSLLYGWGVTLRNVAYDNGWLKSSVAPLPTICVGNLSAGGTGKTPHIEFLIRKLQSRYRLGVLSRGYGRQQKQALEVKVEHTPEEVGDEPLQIKRKFPEITVYVDGNRCRALEQLAAREGKERPELVLLDDGFQHRALKPDYSILLSPFDDPFTRDSLLPYGRLREPQEGKYRANAVILTKAPVIVKPIDFTLLEGELELHAHQLFLYSHLKQMTPVPLRPSVGEPLYLPTKARILAVLGIARPKGFLERCQKEGYQIVEECIFKDHHPFTLKETDIFRDKLETDHTLHLLCTEKDAIRLESHISRWPEHIRKRAFFVPIEISMRQEFSYTLIRDIEKIITKVRQRK